MMDSHVNPLCSSIMKFMRRGFPRPLAMHIRPRALMLFILTIAVVLSLCILPFDRRSFADHHAIQGPVDRADKVAAHTDHIQQQQQKPPLHDVEGATQLAKPQKDKHLAEPLPPANPLHEPVDGNVNARLAKSLYRLRHSRDPPPGYDKWLKRAADNRCFIHNYDQIYEDLAPFIQMGSKQFRARTNVIARAADRMNPVKFENGNIAGGSFWAGLLSTFAADIPTLQIYINALDEPRVLVNLQGNVSLESALADPLENPNWIVPARGTHKEVLRKHCIFHSTQKPLDILNDEHGFLIEPDTTYYTTSLLPILSPTRISPCFSDILIPSGYYYPLSPGPDTSAKPWSERKGTLYWRGSSTGGHHINENYRHFHRQKLVALGKKHPEYLDVGFSGIPQCTPPDCDKVKEEYGVVGRDPFETVYNHKYVIDIDGNTYSGRYFRLLVSGGLVFKMTIFSEYFDHWLVPYEHYIPIQPDLSDLVEKIQWARDNDALAQRIANQGREFAIKHLNNGQMECYVHLLLLEMARLWNGSD